MWLSSRYFNEISACFLYSKKSEEHVMNRYSAFMLDSDTPVIDVVNSIQPIFVSYTSTQPEKALSFVNWLYTDEEVAELLSFGTDQGLIPGLSVC
jgi:hypothetical protein